MPIRLRALVAHPIGVVVAEASTEAMAITAKRTALAAAAVVAGRRPRARRVCALWNGTNDAHYRWGARFLSMPWEASVGLEIGFSDDPFFGGRPGSASPIVSFCALRSSSIRRVARMLISRASSFPPQQVTTVRTDSEPSRTYIITHLGAS